MYCMDTVVMLRRLCSRRCVSVCHININAQLVFLLLSAPLIINNMKFNCRLCNAFGTESCPDKGKCACRPLYDGEYCQHCRYAHEFVMTANGTCVPCPCSSRPLSECLQSRICLNLGNISIKEGTVASALFIATLIAVVIVTVYVIWRVFKRTKRFRWSVRRRPFRVDEYAESEAGNHSTATDNDAGLWKDDERLLFEDVLPTPLPDSNSVATNLFYIQSPCSPVRKGSMTGSKSHSSFLSRKQFGAGTRSRGTNRSSAHGCSAVPNLNGYVGDFDDSGYKSETKISSSCSEYYFLSLQEGNVDDDY